MKDKSKFKAKAPAAKRALKSAAKGRKSAGVSKGEGTRSKKAAVKAKAPAAKMAKTRTAEKPAAKRAAKTKKPAAESKLPGAKIAKRKVKVEDTADFRIGEPVLDPIGDVISGEARTYLGGAETAALNGTLETGPGMEAASGAGAAGGADEDEAEDETSAVERPPAKLERLQKILSRAGIASRRRAEEMMVAGRVMVNGQVVTQLGSKADPARDHIRVDGKLVQGAERHRYFVLNKPRGYVTTVSDPEGRPTVMEFFAKMHERLYPVGRLDYQSEGLLLMTNDGELANLLTKAGSGVEKVYLVKVAGQPSEEELERLRGGVTIEKGGAGTERVRTGPARIRQVRAGENPWYQVVLTEGRNRELRKMFASVGHFAEKIRRVGYGPLVLDVEPGKLRELKADEVNALRLTAEGKMKPRRVNIDRMLPKEVGKPAEKQRRFGESRGKGERPQWQRPERGKRKEWRPRKTESGGERREFRGGARRDFGAERQKFGGEPHKEFRGGERREFRGGGSRREHGESRFEGAARKPFGEWIQRPRFERGEGRFDGRAGRERGKESFGSGERRPFNSRATGPRGERQQFDRGERPRFEKRGERRRRFEGGGGRSFGKGGKLRGKPGSFAGSRESGRGGLRGGGGRGRKFGGNRPGAVRGGWKRGSTRKPQS